MTLYKNLPFLPAPPFLNRGVGGISEVQMVSVMVSADIFIYFEQLGGGGWGQLLRSAFPLIWSVETLAWKDVHFTALVCRQREIAHAWEQACARDTLAWPTARGCIALKAVGFQKVLTVFLTWFFWGWAELSTLCMKWNRSFGSLALTVGLW